MQRLLLIITFLFSSCDIGPEDLREAAKDYDALATLEFKKDMNFAEGKNEIEFDYIPRVSSKRFLFGLYFPQITGDTIDSYFKSLENGILPFIDGLDFQIYDDKNRLIYNHKYKLKDRISVTHRPSAGVYLGGDVRMKNNKNYKIKLVIPAKKIKDEKLAQGQFIIGLGWSIAWP